MASHHLPLMNQLRSAFLPAAQGSIEQQTALVYPALQPSQRPKISMPCLSGCRYLNAAGPVNTASTQRVAVSAGLARCLLKGQSVMQGSPDVCQVSRAHLSDVRDHVKRVSTWDTHRPDSGIQSLHCPAGLVGRHISAGLLQRQSCSKPGAKRLCWACTACGAP